MIFGYLSLLLCSLSLDNDIRTHLRRELALGADGAANDGIIQLLSTVNEFLDYYRKVDEQEGSGTRIQGASTGETVDNTSTNNDNDRDKQMKSQAQTQHDPRVGFTTRLEAIVQRVQAADDPS